MYISNQIGIYNLSNIIYVYDLGVVLSDDLSFTEQVNLICSSAVWNKGFLKRNCSEFNNSNCLIT